MAAMAIEKVLWAFRERVLDLKQDRRFRSILVFKNHGAAAGATVDHSYSQLIALPIVPVRCATKSKARGSTLPRRSAAFIATSSGRSRRRAPGDLENADFVALSPYAPRFAFETWLLPKRHGASFEMPPRHEYESLARMVKETLQRINRTLLAPPFNLIIHSAPFQDGLADVYHWHVEIMPTLTKVAGFEWEGF